MPDATRYSEESAAVQAHLGIKQAVIARMASNSTNCKTWCITLVSAILVIVAEKAKPAYTLIAVIPTVLFLALDAYYLALEKCFRDSYNGFIAKLHEGNVEPSDLYAVNPSGSVLMAVFCALLSFSIWPFYVTLIVMVLVIRRFIQ